MNRSKGAAVLMLIGAFAAGAASTYTIRELSSSPPTQERNPCPRRNESNYTRRVYDLLELSPAQRAQSDSLLDHRRRSVNELMANPLAKRDSIYAEYNRNYRALLTTAQRTKLEEREAAMRARVAERQKLCEQQQATSKDSKSTSSK